MKTFLIIITGFFFMTICSCQNEVSLTERINSYLENQTFKTIKYKDVEFQDDLIIVFYSDEKVEITKPESDWFDMFFLKIIYDIDSIVKFKNIDTSFNLIFEVFDNVKNEKIRFTYSYDGCVHIIEKKPKNIIFLNILSYCVNNMDWFDFLEADAHLKIIYMKSGKEGFNTSFFNLIGKFANDCKNGYLDSNNVKVVKALIEIIDNQNDPLWQFDTNHLKHFLECCENCK
jgi:hypothetical protein